MYLTVNPRWATGTESGLYVGTRARGKALAAPIVTPTSALSHRADVGMLLTPAGGNRGETLAHWSGSRWAADTGCFRHPETFSVAAYLDWLAALAPYRDRCLFATAPDRVGDAAATWAVAAPVLPQLRALGYRAALVAQDGWERLPVDWGAFDCLFVGGSTRWKLSEAAYGLVREARARGKWTHQGRCNSWRRLRAAHAAGYDSADGTCLRYNPPLYTVEITGWLDRLQAQPALPLVPTLGPPGQWSA